VLANPLGHLLQTTKQGGGRSSAAKKGKADEVFFGPLVEIESRRQDAIAVRVALERELGLEAAAAKLAKPTAAPRAAAGPQAGAAAAPAQPRATRRTTTPPV
jgi:hypothetical protein